MRNLNTYFAKLRLILLFCLYLTSPVGLKSQSFPTVKDSIQHFLDSVFTIVPSSALYADKINWSEAKSDLIKKAKSMESFSDVFPQWQLLFDKMEDNHSFFWHRNHKYASHFGQLNEEDVRTPLIAALNDGKAIVTASRLGSYAYVLVPPDNSSDDFDDMQQSAQILQEAICNIYSEDIKGWIIDLRLNTGGNMYPMIAGIQQLIGEGVFGSIRKKDGTTLPWSIKANGIYQAEERITALATPCLPDLSQDKVVVLTSQMTGSSGEITALAFLNRPKTFFIGEKTAGFMTSNELYRLPFETFLLLAEGYELDSQEKLTMSIMPHRIMIEGDNFEHLDQDAKIKAAMEWLRSN
ncbi:MAG: hypothetical protein HEP71_05525 [Roseivirga sp.]|nr:hypothetical protein [Roseivirga sp.]